MMIPFSQIDAFADRPFTGNPAAVMPLDTWLDDTVLQSIALENNLSETAFLIPDASGDSDYELRWFTPAAEVALCGHATLASGHFILSMDQAIDRVTFRTRRAGILEVARDGADYAMALPAWTPSPKPLPEIVKALGIAAPVETLWHDKGYALVIVSDEATVRTLQPDLSALARCGQYVVIVSAAGEETDVVSRVFTPAFDIPEDPVTGSAHAVMVPWWAARLKRESFTAYQASARGGYVGCRLSGDKVVLTGNCITVIEGMFRI
ncbi:MAG: PhzF family phenazine biosynthesis protein [Pseudomonadota bacterium]